MPSVTFLFLQVSLTFIDISLESNSLLSWIIMTSNTQKPPVDLYDQEPDLEDVPNTRRQVLQEQATKFAAAFQKMKQQPFFSQKYYYIVSARWLRRWKQYVSFDQLATNKPTAKLFGCGQLPRLNQDIVESIINGPLFLPTSLRHLQVKLKANLSEHKDYYFLNEQCWEILATYDNYEVKRFVVETPDGYKVELYYQSLTLVPVWNNLLKDVEQQRITKLQEVNLQYSHNASIGNLIDDFEGALASFGKKQSYGSRFPNSNFIRLWLLPERTRKTILYNTLQQGCKANPSFTYKLYLQGQLLSDDTLIRDVQLLPDSLIVAELREEGQKWLFFNLKHKLEAPCSYCKKVSLLNYVCSCKHAVYCTKECKQSDKGHHKYRCPNDAQSDQEDKQLVMSENSRKGLAGLRNLGNTCFMNSGLQCLSHIKELTDYFLTGKYLHDINEKNPLGTQGELSKEYAKMIKSLWLGEESSFSPTHLKKSIAKFQPMFSGYNQHDSGQLITYLLDGLHEDLNRVIVKPYTQTKDYDGRPDHVVAKQSWQTYLKRNQSVIVDLMYGQFKSIVQCPNQECKFLSITFDPFSVCSLPLVDNSRKSIELVVLKQHIYSKKINFSYTVEKDYTVEDKTQQLKEAGGLDAQSRLLMYVASYTSCDSISNKQQIEEIRREYKYRTIFIRQLQPFQNPEKDIKIMLGHVICNPYYSDESYRKNIVPFQLVYVNVNITNKQVYQLIFSRYAKIMEGLNLPNLQDVMQLQEEKEPVRLLLITASRYFTCSYCSKKNCTGCKLPYNDQLFREHIGYNPESEYSRDKRIEIEMYWRKNEKEVEKVFEQLGEKSQNSSKGMSGFAYKPPSIKIEECINMFEKEEILGQDNLWFCPRCKDFVPAKKQMKIYKAPKILIFCLKRFKRKEYFSEKISALVDFPIEGFDVTPYICNRNLPNQNEIDGKMEIEGPLLYDLVGISNHFGSTGGGHYTAFCKDPLSGDWYDFDDSSVSKLRSKEDVVTQSAYILFYQRRE